MNRRQGREAAFSVLFQVFEGECTATEALNDWQQEHELPDDDATLAFVTNLVNGCAAVRPAMDAVIEAHLVDWTFDRISSADKHLLRLSLYELLHTGTPPPVIINEAVLLAKKFGDDGSPGFINGLLGRVAREREAAT